MQRSLIWIGLTLGSAIGSFLPSIWGASPLSFEAVLLGAAGGIAGIWAGYRISQAM